MTLINGKVLFSDCFIKPNYSANLNELTGKLSVFAPDRLVFGAAKAVPAQAKWTPRAELNLAMP